MMPAALEKVLPASGFTDESATSVIYSLKSRENNLNEMADSHLLAENEIYRPLFALYWRIFDFIDHILNYFDYFSYYFDHTLILPNKESEAEQCLFRFL
ncbi:hypothetical protein [Bacillus sp. ISL-55]|uniref:hypothetical protein n=1 Tax=Bacillus sp. ISL-55 TaxID=2819134 RepID=UPI001BE6909F|nr:hypothetical protein [Bacillus sp. ISL-55]MBT2691899.1 hypothetical protein [Bacillus sp. ISL-55]